MWSLVIIGSYVISFGSLGLYNVLFERKKKKLGYVNLKKSRVINELFEFPKESRESKLYFWAGWVISLCPIINLIWVAPLIIFKFSSEHDLSYEYNKGDIVTVEKAKKMLDSNFAGDNEFALKVLKVRKAQMKYEKYLQKKQEEYDETMLQIENTYRDISLPGKVVAVRRLQSKSTSINKPIPFSEYTPDEKIAMLLPELEQAFKEKAKLEGTDIEEEVKLLLESENHWRIGDKR